MVMWQDIPLLAEEGWRDSLIEAGAPGWSVRTERFAELTTPSATSLRSAQLLLRLRPIGLALRALLCEEGNDALAGSGNATIRCRAQRCCRETSAEERDHQHRSGKRRAFLLACPSGIRCDAASAGEPTAHS